MEHVDDFFYEENFYYESSVAIIDNRLVRAIIQCEEAYSDKHYLTESDKKSLIVSVRDFFSKLINAITTFMKNIKLKIDNFINSNKVDIDLMQKKSHLEALKKKGVTSVTTIDYNAYKNTYLKAVDSAWKYAERLEKMSYKKGDQIENDLKHFKSVLAKYDEKLNKINEKKISVPIDKAIEQTSDELHGKSKIFQTIRECETKLREMQISVENIQQKYDISGDEIIPKKVNMVKKICSDIANFIRKHVAKILGVAVFILAI